MRPGAQCSSPPLPLGGPALSPGFEKTGLVAPSTAPGQPDPGVFGTDAPHRRRFQLRILPKYDARLLLRRGGTGSPDEGRGVHAVATVTGCAWGAP
jgi:hypothetical protein